MNHFRDFRLLLDEQADKIYAAMTQSSNAFGSLERKRCTPSVIFRAGSGCTDSDVEYLLPIQMLKELRDENLRLAAYLREAHEVCDDHGDVASAGLLGSLIDDAEQRIWYLFETCCQNAAPEESSG